MDIKQIKTLAQLMEAHNLNILEVCEGETRIRLEKNCHCESACASPIAEKPAKAADKTNKPLSSSSSSPVDFNNIIEVKSPMVGVFYSAPSPGSEPFVKIGDRVKKGDVLCIIEAMKLMNEICAEHEGEIVDICAENEQIVEYNQTLFKIY
jgi:acetyl-CoA carboxylase biotin carboxyl carrier protein